MSACVIQMTAAAEDAEFYPTPAWAVRRLLEHPAFVVPAGLWFDPCVGDGAIPRAVNGDDLGFAEWRACDVRLTQWMRENNAPQRDYLIGAEIKYGCAIFNPPFSKALAFAKKAVTHCNHVYMLQRRHWLTAALRQDRAWIAAHKPAEFLFPDRIQFVNGASDSQEYEWYYWGAAITGLHFLAATPLEDRRVSPRVDGAQQRLGLEEP